GHILLATFSLVATLVSWSYAGKRKFTYAPCMKICKKYNVAECKNICIIKKGYVVDAKCWNDCLDIKTEQHFVKFKLTPCMDKCQKKIVGCRWTRWTPWRLEPCSVTCGRGTRSKYRTRTEEFGAFGSSTCIGSTMQYCTEICNIGNCARQVCKWSIWTRWHQGGCSASCGVGSRTDTRTRSKLYGNSESGEGVVECFGNNIEQKTETCTNDVCRSQVCRWSDWSPWQQGACSVTCGQGSQTNAKYRSKIYTFEQYGQRECYGNEIERTTVSCYIQECYTPIVCKWNIWSAWQQGVCSVTCGTGTRTETRTRIKLYGKSGGDGCFGSSIEQRGAIPCYYMPCPVPTPVCRWSPWSTWQQGICSVTCGWGTRTETRTRSKLYGQSQSGRDGCFGSSIEQRGAIQCYFQSCPVSTPVCRWSNWGAWIIETACISKRTVGTPTCYYSGTARYYRTRQCHCRGKRTGGGTTYTQCVGVSIERAYKPCCVGHVSPPPTGCGWGPWGPWIVGTTCIYNGQPSTHTCICPGVIRYYK
ncbi:unnamed protein product, partial [Owenia fusiformis]